MTPPPSGAEAARRSRTFRTASAFRGWLKKNHATAAELLVRCFKVSAAAEGVTYREALDEALCFGWIDGVRRGMDGKSFSVRFSPRRPGSRWSAVNTRRAAELKREGRMHPSGIAAFGRRRASRYSFETEDRKLSAGFLREFRRQKDAWEYYASQPPWYGRVTAFWVMSAVRPETRARRFAQLLQASRRKMSVAPLKRKNAG